MFISVDCPSYPIAHLIQLSISVDRWSQSILHLSWLSISVDCPSQFIVHLSWLSISVDCPSQLIVHLSHLSISVICQCQSFVYLSHLFISVVCPSQKNKPRLCCKSAHRFHPTCLDIRFMYLGFLQWLLFGYYFVFCVMFIYEMWIFAKIALHTICKEQQSSRKEWTCNMYKNVHFQFANTLLQNVFHAF